VTRFDYNALDGYAKADFDGCRPATENDGLVQVICRHQDAWGQDENGADVVTLAITGTTNSGGLGFEGNTLPVKIVGTCAPE